MSVLGKLVRKQRNEMGLTLRAAGKAAGVSFVTIRDIERGHVGRPTQETLEGLAQALDVPIGDLATAVYAEAPAKRKVATA